MVLGSSETVVTLLLRRLSQNAKDIIKISAASLKYQLSAKNVSMCISPPWRRFFPFKLNAKQPKDDYDLFIFWLFRKI